MATGEAVQEKMTGLMQPKPARRDEDIAQCVEA